MKNIGANLPPTFSSQTFAYVCVTCVLTVQLDKSGVL